MPDSKDAAPTVRTAFRPPDAITHLLRLRADMVRMAHEVEGLADHMTGKGAPRARRKAADVARRMRDKAMAHDVAEACKR